jgi:hypothetical protein
MNSYLPANVVPRVNSLTGVSRVLVGEAEISSEGRSGAAQLLQKRESEVLSV